MKKLEERELKMLEFSEKVELGFLGFNNEFFKYLQKVEF